MTSKRIIGHMLSFLSAIATSNMFDNSIFRQKYLVLCCVSIFSIASAWTNEFCTVPVPIWDILSSNGRTIKLKTDGEYDGREIYAEIRQMGSCHQSKHLGFESGGPWAEGADMNMLKLQEYHDWNCGSMDGGCTQPGIWGIDAPDRFVNYPLTALTLDAHSEGSPGCLVAQESTNSAYQLVNAGQGIVVSSKGFNFPPQTIMTTNIDSEVDHPENVPVDSADWTMQRSEASVSFALKSDRVVKPMISVVEGWNGSQAVPWIGASDADAWTMQYNPLNISNTVNKRNPQLQYNYTYLQQQSLDKFNIVVKSAAFKALGFANIYDTEIVATSSNFRKDDNVQCRYGIFPIIDAETDATLCIDGEAQFCTSNPVGGKDACPRYMRKSECASNLYPAWIGDGESDHCTSWATFTSDFDSKHFFGIFNLSWPV
jgi:hypothetical protein